ncbi:HAAS signaling domain-containing protein [Sutcliffiella halmapala]|uniref:HAAS signaling domain-containing protein n=1 Tax=Sutcliffiella halmapala TaxID=79882 RepID=UPI000994D4BE|nr:DUF1700 domain-containing protein [Sutcliffiella halmapala]
MNKKQFLETLDSFLKRMPIEERQDIIHDFEEHFAIGLAEGKSEEQIAASLGSPQQIAKDLNATYHLEKVEVSATTGNIFRAMWAVIGLGFFNLLVVLAPFIALVSVIIGGWALGIGFIASPLLVLGNAVIFPATFAFFDLFFSLALCGIGLFIAIGMFFATRALAQGFVRYLKFNMKLVKGGLKND